MHSNMYIYIYTETTLSSLDILKRYAMLRSLTSPGVVEDKIQVSTIMHNVNVLIDEVSNSRFNNAYNTC